MTEGERFCVTDGEGSLYDAELVEALPKHATVNLTNKRPGYDHWGFNLEIGIDRVRLFTSYHSERRAANVERFQKVMIAAMKQSIKSRLPKIDDDVKACLCDLYKKGENVLVLIGPEGDFSPEEVALAKENGFVPCSLGDARLKTETAAMVACHTIQLINQMK